MSNPRRAAIQHMASTGSRKRSGSVADDYEASTPRLGARFSDQPAQEIPPEETTTGTPTPHGFGGIPGQRPLPDDRTAIPPVKRENSRRSMHSHASTDSQDVDVDMGEDDDEGLDQLGGSDGESASGDKPSRKKKKGQRFYCTDFPPCQLSFTRSEHLARHIRKHTGERPFECHCSRRFSRLDNLRQHAQTVHVNEDIPGDSLAATGTRFQRQIRTDRVRPPNVRPRASTASSSGHGAHGRGHSRNLSASSVTSTTSSVGLAEDNRPRPTPLVLGQDAAARARLSLDTFNPAIPNTGGPQFAFYQQSPTGYSSPTSTTFSPGGSSPQFTATMHSPSLSLSRSSFYNGSRTPSRRLSVPSAISPYHTSTVQSAAYPPVYFGALPSNATPQYQNTPSMGGSPTSSVFSHRRHESDAELEWRRRTWHPGTHAAYANRPATSGLTYHQTPDDVAPALASQPAASQITRLPGIESFDAPPRPVGHTRNATSPMCIDSRPLFSGPPDGPASADDRKIVPAWEANLHHNLNNLDIARAAPPDQSRLLMSDNRPVARQHAHTQHPRPTHALPHFQFPAPAADSTPVDRASKRQAWYGGPMPPPQATQPIMIAHRTSPDTSGSEGIPTPSTSHGRELHPAIMHANGMIELQSSGAPLTEEQRAMQAHYQGKPEPVRADSGFHTYVHVSGQGPPVYMMQTGHDVHVQPPEWRPAATPARPNNDMGRLEALVAVATSENRAVEYNS